MPLFLSTHINKVDKKGRVSLPSGFRAALSGQSFQGVVVFRSNNHDCLEGFAYSYMEELSARLDNFDLFSSEQDDLATTIFSEAVQLPLDGNGRVILPADLVEYAEVGEEAAFVGLGQKFQIWNPSKLQDRRDEARSVVKSKGLTVPKHKASGEGER
ncbi:MAG: division/cell wall cluster transcriptional repressor MraZ [Alphaproteobacteria bacterium]|nr:division/cell wall cluster transcriptional repressor MraZ [Alphaproteobacteria bacterium]